MPSKLKGWLILEPPQWGIAGFVFDLQDAYGGCELVQSWLLQTHDGFPKRVKNPTLPATVRLQRALEIERSALIQIAMA